MTVLSETVGVGNVVGQLSDTFLPLLVMVTNGPVPPPENAMSAVLAPGANDPSVRRASLVSTGTQPASFRMRTGPAFCVSVSVPSGLATVCAFSLVSASTTTW
ncbi:hypothetical protein ACFYNO_03190 [Kitasatospora sp. NPDC006697]|uniref:hypothetical protein n=1 Tax=Kitasatospora sp. NPDC006697 TaxID=3364020 RepID=UPI0036B0211E